MCHQQWRSYVKARSAGLPFFHRKTCLGALVQPLCSRQNQGSGAGSVGICRRRRRIFRGRAIREKVGWRERGWIRQRREVGEDCDGIDEGL
ncbi:26S protease regulatory subunit 6A-like [Pyrus ussuriensis x Pyrus communis]|uniref:26S protease regulatory subunit 6A-like n=1 Tax=Pyrus ussuriensis x Pyrus communis TaxID=2448454 RepID=A0A5N5FA72_9ROSA|nr:26S protease regulatory subunit 6A-like [Pyrus ussuriensis x Pyrus communis]